MSVNLGSAHGSIEIDASGVQKGVDQAASALASLTGIAGKIGGGIATGVQVGVTALAGLGAAAAAGFAGVVAASTNAAAKVEQSVANIKSIKPEIDTSALYDQLTTLSTQVPQSAQELADSLYNIFSSIDISQSDALKLLESFSKGATAAQTDAQTFGTAILGVMNAYGKSVADADHISDVFFNTVNRGVITSEELATQLGQVTGAAKQTGTSFEELGALIVGVTKEGGSAATNVNNLANLLNKIQTDKAQEGLHKLGIATTDASGNFRSVIDVLGDLKTRLDGLSESERAETLMKIFPDVQARNAATTLLNQLDAVRGALDENANSAGSADKAFQNMFDTFSSQSKILKHTAQATLQGIGKAFLPLATDAARGLSGLLKSLQPALDGLAQSAATAMASIATSIRSTFAQVEPLFASFFNTLKTGDWEAFRKQIADTFGDTLVGKVAATFARIAQLGADTFKTIGQAWRGEWQTAPSIQPFVKFVGRITQLAADTFHTIQQVFAGDWVSSDKIQPVVDGIGAIAKSVKDNVIPALGHLKDDAGKVFDALATAVGSPAVQDGINTIAHAVADVLLPALSTMIPKVADLAAKMAEVISPAVADRFNTLSKVIRDDIAPALATVFVNAGLAADALSRAITPGVLDSFGKLADVILKLAGRDISQTLQLLAGAILAIGAAAAFALPPLAKLIDKIDELYGLQTILSFTFNLTPLSIAAKLFDILLQKIKLLQAAGGGDFWAGFDKGIANITAGVQKFIGTLGANLGDFFSKFGASMNAQVAGWGQTIGTFFSGLGSAAQAGVSAIGAAFSGLGTFVSTALGAAGAAIGTFFSNLGTQAQAAVGGVGAFFSSLGTLAQSAVASIGAAFSALGTAASGALAGATAAIGAFFANLGTLASGAVAAIGAAFSGLGAAVAAAVAAAGAGIGAFFSSLGSLASAAVAAIGAAFSGLGGAASAGIAALQGAVASGFAAIVGIVTSSASAITSAAESGWSAVTGAVSAAIAAIQTVVAAGWAAITGVIASAMAEVQSVIGSAWSAVQGVVDGAMASLQGAIASGFAACVALAAGFGGQIVGAIGDLSGQLYAAGVAAITGLTNGILAAGEQAVAAAASIASRVAGAIGDALQIHSPSKVTEAQGEETAQGLAVGLEKGTPDAVDSATGLATSVANAIAAILDAFGKLATFRMPSQAVLGALGSAITGLVTIMTDVIGGVGADTLQSAKDFADAIGAVVGAVKDGVDALRGLGRLVIPAQDQMRAFAAGIAVLVQAFGDAAAGMSQEFLDSAKSVAAVASASVDVIGKGLDALAQLSSWVRPTDKAIGDFKFAVEWLVRSFGDSAIFLGSELLAAAKQLAEAASACVDVVAKGLEPLQKLATFMRPTNEKIGDFKFAVEWLVRSFGDAAISLGDNLLDSAKAFSDAALKSVQVLEPGIKGLAALTKVSRLPSAGEIGAFKFAVEALVRSFADSAQMFSTAGLQAAKDFADAASAVTGMISDALSGLLELARGPIVLTDAAFNNLVDLVVRAVKAIAYAATLVDRDALAAAQAFADSAGSVVQLIGTAVSAFVDLSTITAASGANLDALKTLIVRAVNAIADAAKYISSDALQAAQDFAAAAGPVVQLIGTAVSAFQTEPLKEGEQPKGLMNPDQIAGLVALIRTSMDLLIGLAQQYDRGQLARVADLASTAQAGMSALKSASDTFTEPAKPEEGQTGPEQLIANLGALLQQALNDLQSLQTLADAFSARAIAIADQIAAARQRVLDALSPFGPGILNAGALAAGALATGGAFTVRAEIAYTFSPIQFQMMSPNGGWIVSSLQVDGASRAQVADMVADVIVQAAPQAA